MVMPTTDRLAKGTTVVVSPANNLGVIIAIRIRTVGPLLQKQYQVAFWGRSKNQFTKSWFPGDYLTPLSDYRDAVQKVWAQHDDELAKIMAAFQKDEELAQIMIQPVEER